MATTAWATKLSLHELLSGRQNSLNAVRLVLAALVVLGHAWPLTGSTAEPRLEGLSGIAVNGFFAVSGYLIAASRMNTALLAYLWRRVLRIFPAFLVCLVTIAAGFAPLAAALEGTAVSAGSAAGFVFHNALLSISQWGIMGTLAAVPYHDVWNGSLWTLSYEFLAYLAIGALLTVPWVRLRTKAIVPLLSVLAIVGWVLIEGPIHVSTNAYHDAARLGSYFLVGSAMYCLSGHVPVRRSLTAVALVAYIGLWLVGVDNLLGQLPLAYLLLVVGARPASGFTTRNDLSYGLYIYAFPTQQFLVVLGTATWGVAANSGLTLVLAAGLAWLSWRFVERPALSLKNAQAPRLWRRSADTAEPMDA
jgi:peptidoglycan/LPS O-acetylase OafA/YrhL